MPENHEHDGLLVRLCKDHFERLVRNEPCTTCPSRADSEWACKAMSENLTASAENTTRVIASEIQSMRRWQIEMTNELREIKEVHKTVERIRGIVCGPDDQNGLRGIVRELQANVSQLTRLVWVAMGVGIAVNAIVIPWLHRLMEKQ